MWLILPVVCLLLFIVFLRRKYGTLERLGIPVIPPGVCLGSEPLMIHKTNYIDWDMDCTRKYGKVWGSYAVSEPWITVGDPELIKAIAVKYFDHFNSHSFEIGNQKYRTINMATGDEWRDLRKGLSPTFTSGKIKGMLDLLGDSVDNMIDHLEEVTAKDPVVDVKNIFTALTLDVIAKCAFGIESNSFKNPDNQVFKHGKKIFDDFKITSVGTSIFFQVFMACASLMKYLDVTSPSFTHLWNLTRSVQSEREKRGAGSGDFIDRLNELNQKWKRGDFPSLTSEQITGQVEQTGLDWMK